MRSWRQTMLLPAGGGCARHGLHASAAARRLAAALPRPGVQRTSTVTSNLQYGSAPDSQGNPVALRLDLYRAGRRHADEPAGARLGPRRRLQRRRQGQLRARRRRATPSPSSATSSVSINYRLLALTAASGNPGQPPARSPRSTPSTTPRRPSAGCAATPATYGIDPDPDRHRRRVRRRDHRDAGRPALRGPRQAAATRASRRRSRGFVSISGGLPERRSSRARATRSGLFFHGDRRRRRALPSWSDATTAAMLDAGVPALAAASGRRGPRALASSTARSTSSRASYFLYLALDLAHAAGQPTSAARALRTAAASGWPRARGRSGCCSSHPQLRRLEKRARPLAHFVHAHLVAPALERVGRHHHGHELALVAARQREGLAHGHDRPVHRHRDVAAAVAAALTRPTTWRRDEAARPDRRRVFRRVGEVDVERLQPGLRGGWPISSWWGPIP